MSTNHPDGSGGTLRLGQLFSVVVIAIGAGLLVAGSSFDPSIRPNEVTDRIPRFVMAPREVEFYFGLSAAFKGFGTAALVMGILALIVPWLNALFYRRKEHHPVVTPSTP